MQHGELGNQCKDAGSHYNPTGQQHGPVDSESRHHGDFGNILADSTNSSTVRIFAAADMDQLVGRSVKYSKIV